MDVDGTGEFLRSRQIVNFALLCRDFMPSYCTFWWMFVFCVLFKVRNLLVLLKDNPPVEWRPVQSFHPRCGSIAAQLRTTMRRQKSCWSVASNGEEMAAAIWKDWRPCDLSCFFFNFLYIENVVSCVYYVWGWKKSSLMHFWMSCSVL